MIRKSLQHLKKRLENELAELQRGISCNFDGLKDSEENMPDLIDRASNFTDRSLSQNICDRESLRIRKLEQALEDLANGEYGICQCCGEDIAIKRLKANPVARHCIGCKTEMETRERLIGV
jgi:DnaK suppressor protein